MVKSSKISRMTDEKSNPHQELVDLKRELDNLKRQQDDFFNKSPYLMYEIDFRGPKLLRVNDALCKRMGYTREELLSKDPMALLDEESKKKFQERINKSLAGEEQPDWTEYTGYTKDGSKLVGELYIQFKYENGKPVGALVTAHDITKREKAEEKTKRILESITESYIELDNEWRYVDVNSKIEEIYSIDRNELIGKVIWDVFPQAVESKQYKQMHKAKKENVSVHFESKSKVTGEWYEIYIYPHPDGLSVYSHDITDRKKAEEALKASDETFNAFFNASPATMDIFDKDFRYIHFNKAVEKFYNKTADDIRGKSVEEIAPGFLNVVKEPFEAVLRTGAAQPPVEIHGESPRGQGIIEYFLLLCFPVPLPNGEWGIGVVAQDITDRKKAETDIQRTLLLLDSINKVFEESLICETVEEVVSKCLDVAEDLTDSKFSFIGEINENGRLDDRAVSHPGWERCTADKKIALELLSNMEIVSYWGRTINEGKSQIVNDPNSDPDRRGLPKGHPPINSFLGVPLLQGTKTIGMIALANKEGGYSDTDRENIEVLSFAFVEALMRKKAEIAIHLEKDKLSSLINSIPDEIWYADADANLELVNPTVVTGFGKDLKGREVEEIAGESEVYRPDGTPRPVEEAPPLRALKGEIVENQGEIVKIPTTGEVQYRQVNSMPVKDADNNIIGSVSVVRDISEMKKAEEKLQELLENEQQYREELQTANTELLNLQENLKESIHKLEISNKELEQFAYVASHDLQEPLRMVGSFTQLLEKKYKDNLDADADDYIGFIVKGSHRMKDLIDDLLKFSRLNTEKKEFQLSDLNQIFDSVILDMKSTIEEENAHIIRDNLPIVSCDSSQIGQVFQNLISNSIKFHQTPPLIHISAEENDNEWILGISDEGIGIDPDHHQKIFDVFKRLHTREEYAGTGIGLSICKRIIERHNGRIWVESEPGKGANFYFTIPKKS